VAIKAASVVKWMLRSDTVNTATVMSAIPASEMLAVVMSGAGWGNASDAVKMHQPRCGITESNQDGEITSIA
jgi:hypothetical protein